MLETGYPDANRSQDPVLGQKNHFDVYQNVPSVQILHDGVLHSALQDPVLPIDSQSAS